jgi:hypothetical protein
MKLKLNAKIKLQTEAVTLLGRLTGSSRVKQIPLVSRLSAIIKMLVAFVAPIFKRAKTAAEFHNSTGDLAKYTKSMHKVSLDSLNACGEAMTEAFSRFFMPKMEYFGTGSTAPIKHRLGKRTPACYTHPKWGFGKGVDQIVINPELSETESQDDKDSTAAAMEEQYPFDAHKALAYKRAKDPRVQELIGSLTQWNWGISGTAGEVMYHEIGHRWHHYMITHQDKGDNIQAVLNAAWAGGWKYLVSQYGMTNIKEFMAESFSLYMQNKHELINPELLALMKKYDKAVA